MTKEYRDDIVEEIHRGREEHAAKLGWDFDRIAEDIRSREGTDGHEVVKPAPKRIEAVSPFSQVKPTPGADTETSC